MEVKRILQYVKNIGKTPENRKKLVIAVLLLLAAVILIWPFVFPIRVTDSRLPYEYTLHGTYVEINRYTGNEEEVTIPDTIWFRPVARIGEEAFADQAIKSVYLPDSVKELGAFSFGRCRNLEEVHLSGGLKSIEYAAFGGCLALQKIEIPEGVEEICGSAFRGCESLETVFLPDTLKRIRGHAFSLCKNLETVTFPDTLKIIGGGAFEDCEKLEYVEIPEGVEEIWGNSFRGTGWEKSFGEGFVVVGKNVLIHYGGQEEIVEVPEGVEYVGDYVFGDCENMEQLVLPESLKKCSNTILVDYDNLKYVICKNPDMEFQEIEITDFLRRLKPIIVGEKGTAVEAYVTEVYAKEVECTFQDIALWDGEEK